MLSPMFVCLSVNKKLLKFYKDVNLILRKSGKFAGVLKPSGSTNLLKDSLSRAIFSVSV